MRPVVALWAVALATCATLASGSLPFVRGTEAQLRPLIREALENAERTRLPPRRVHLAQAIPRFRELWPGGTASTRPDDALPGPSMEYDAGDEFEDLSRRERRKYAPRAVEAGGSEAPLFSAFRFGDVNQDKPAESRGVIYPESSSASGGGGGGGGGGGSPATSSSESWAPSAQPPYEWWDEWKGYLQL